MFPEKLNDERKKNLRNILARNLRIMRESRGYTQNEIANYLGVYLITYHKYEQQHYDCQPIAIMLYALSKLYSCDISRFFIGE